MKFFLKLSILFLSLLITGNSVLLAQTNSKPTIYLDENQNQTNESQFVKKRKNFLYTSTKYKSDTLDIYLLVNAYEFGKLSQQENQQIRNLISRDKAQEINEGKNIVISYMDTLRGFKPNYKGNSSQLVTSEKKHTNRLVKFDNRQEKCIEQFNVLNTEVIYYFGSKENFNYEPKHFEWKPIPQPIFDIFFQTHFSRHILLKPNGEYFIYRYMPEKILKKLIGTPWDSYFNDFETAKKTGTFNRPGIFSKIVPSHYHSNKECYRDSYF